jgi:transposase
LFVHYTHTYTYTYTYTSSKRINGTKVKTIVTEYLHHVLPGQRKVIRYDNLGRHVARLEEAKDMYRPFMEKGSLKIST